MINFGFIWPLLLGAVLCLSSGYAGYHMRDLSAQKEIADGKAAFARRISIANAQTRATRERLAGQIAQSEAKIDEITKAHQNELEKLPNTCVLSDDDMSRLWNDPRNPNRRSSNQPRVRQAPGQAAAP